MKKYLVAVGATSALIMLAGAGCNQMYQTDTATPSNATIDNKTSGSSAEVVALTAEALNPGIVKFNWQVPADFNSNHTFFL